MKRKQLLRKEMRIKIKGKINNIDKLRENQNNMNNYNKRHLVAGNNRSN